MSLKAELMGPTYFNALLAKQDFTFMDVTGEETRTSVYDAIYAAENVANALLARVKALKLQFFQGAKIENLPKHAKRFSDQFEKLKELYIRVNGLAMHLEQGLMQFDASEKSSETSGIANKEDLYQVILNVRFRALDLESDYLEKKTSSWNLESYVSWFNKASAKV